MPIESGGRTVNKKRFRADDPERREWQDPEKILASIGLCEGMTFVDAGCGEGYFAIPAARIVGPRGKVWAFDINPEAIAVLREQAAGGGLLNLRAETGSGEETVLCHSCADLVFFGIDLHDFADPSMVIRNAREMLKPYGTLVDLDWKDIPMAFGPPAHKRFSEEKAAELIAAAGFRIVSIDDTGPYHYQIIARR